MWWLLLVIVALVAIAIVVINARDKIILWEKDDKFIRLFPNPGMRLGEHYVSVRKGYHREH